ncbi:NtaA/DmoA family FMN-dependent monooxygenase [Nakamurella leprariae]|uniref:NtaA/DmoA family FMN-dependent monooxygenase n=1 Tax=Nakamurella leprariae TaxID=2803911 RepID=A0A939BYL2_9ACTN|nr:NtaA/DmoA family FMN-dependent monooxygenase [Nakamurella leprariae]MBM9469658.1 NtaA/DmoA family FMN-dependent monooxygenase [Nakamurella leprariae]
MSSARPLRLGVFEAMQPQVGGTLSWPHPRSQTHRFAELDFWLDYARMLDAAGFDFLFFADSYGFPTLRGELPEATVTGGVNFPILDPMLVLSALAAATERLGLVVTSSTGLDHPIQAARRFGTLDHLTGGRIGWNVVTGSSQNTIAGLFGQDRMTDHADRYAMADEYVELTLRYLEGGWEDGAVLADPTGPVLLDRDRIHRVDFEGTHFRTSGFLSVPPSPQRTPVLFQAGTSTPGRNLAARWAECVFVQATTVEQTAANVADIRRRAAEAGRDPEAITLMSGASVTVAATAERAAAQRAEFDALQTDQVVNALYAGNTGIDLLSLDPTLPLAQALERAGDIGPVGQMGRSNIERFLSAPGGGPTVREILDDLRGKGTRGFQVTGDAVGVSDRLEELADRTGLDGFLLEPLFAPTDLADFAELVMPELRRRGRLPEQAGTGTLRAQLGAGSPDADRLRDDHPGARFRPAVRSA